MSDAHGTFGGVYSRGERRDPPKKKNDEEKAYLNARFFRAAVVAKSAGAGSEADALAAALEEHQKIVAYVDAFGPLPFFEEEAEVSRQFAALLPTKINHLRRLEENNIKAVDPLKKMMAGMGMS